MLIPKIREYSRMKIMNSTLCCLLFLAIAVGLTPNRSTAETRIDLHPIGGAITQAKSTYRWKDVATNTYAQSYKDAYVYSDAIVAISFDPIMETFLQGHLSATNLKPNFAYQMKLAGKPTALSGAAGDDTTNERLGYLGRWWRHQPNPGNSNDADYEANHDEPGYIFEGYLVFAFIVTDSTGSIETDFRADSSYHVLWWEQQRSQGSCDSPVQWNMVIGHADHPAYIENIGPTSVGIYAEIERYCNGTSTMPPGVYDCCFVLTEESFHQSGEDEGNWYSVLFNDALQFEIADLTAMHSQDTRTAIITEPLQPNPFLGRTVLKFTLSKSSPVSFSIYNLSGLLVHRSPQTSRGVGVHQIGWDGKDGSGRRAPAGVYLYRLDIPGGERKVGKVVLIR